ncbi:carboxypeptidase-like regulatory domain-containing protein [Zunongwangia sp. F363]|uniref:Carboxypeptidase-like regulatory domain-containing protein n=2 Tax=Flavobacteriaceae TaxID=49546 RepID=A0ABU3C5J5_9FLAO|nr:carboxypeptidase-like regulatory domain-containing protein [Zunongwangia sp. F363]MDT0641594.1 carboxypeptidase-like regulatory domain-containing protein [Zunongwangia sp. F363]
MNGQTAIQGFVQDQGGSPIEKASVIVYNSSQSILTYSYTDEEGGFLLTIKDEDINNNLLIVAANSLGFQEQQDSLQLVQGKNDYSVIFTLSEKAEQLKEVVLESTKKISANGNITTIQAGAFTNNTEHTVEDVLKKLPGIEVLDDGAIKAHGKFINKLLIDGEDLFANDYQILSRNLDAKTLDEIQIIDKFEDNPVLAKVLDSDKVALNLNLKEKFKNIWFGNVTAGLGTEERVKAAANIGLLRKQIKFFYFGDYNNLGNKASDQLTGSPSSVNITSAYQEQEIEPEINPVFSIPMNENNFFREGQSTFNKALLNSLGFVTKLTQNIELRGTGSFTNDIQNQLFSSETFFNVQEDPVIFYENSDSHHTNTIGSGELEIKYTGGEKSYLKNLFVYQNQPEEYNNNLLFNNIDIAQNLVKKESSFYNHFNYSYVLSKNNVWHNYIYFGQNEVEQNAVIRSPVLNSLFSSPEDSRIDHSSDDKLNVFGFTSNLFSKFGEFEHRLEVGYESLAEDRRNNFILNTQENTLEVDSLRNDLQFERQRLNLNTRLNYSFSDKVELAIGFSLDHLKIKNGRDNKEEWFFNPEVDLDLRKMKIGRFQFSYENTCNFPESIFFLENYQLKNYRSVVQGTEKIYLPKRDVYGFSYKWANELESQAFTLRLKYDDTNGRYSTANQISQDFILSSYRFVNAGDRISGNIDFTSYFAKLKLSTNLRTTQNWFAMPLKANSADFSILKNYSASYLFSGTTYFDLPVNFGFKINLSHSKSQFNGVMSKTYQNNAAVEINYEVSNEWFASLNNDLYQMENNRSYFLGSTISYQPKESNFSYRLKMNNLTGENEFSTIFIDDYAMYKSSVKLLPRFFLFTLKYRF